MIITKELARILSGLEGVALEVNGKMSSANVVDSELIRGLKNTCQEFLRNEQIMNLDKLPKQKR